MNTLIPHPRIAAPNRIKTRRGYCKLLECTLSIVVVMALGVVHANAQRIITTVAGNGERGFSGDGGAATDALLNVANFSGGVAVDAVGNLYIADTGNHRIRKVDLNGTITTLAGNGNPAFSGDAGVAINASLNSPTGVTVDTAGNLYITDTGNQRIRKVGLDGVITTVAGNGVAGFSGDGGLAKDASLKLTEPAPFPHEIPSTNVAIDAAGNLYIADVGNKRIRKVSPDGIISTISGILLTYYSGGVAVDGAGNLYISDTDADRILKIDLSGEVTSVVAGGSFPLDLGDGGPAIRGWINSPTGMTVDADGNLYIAETFHHRVRRIDLEGIITTVAGSGEPCWFCARDEHFAGGFSGDGGPATLAQLNSPGGVAVDRRRNIYIGDSLNNRIRRVSAASTAIPSIISVSVAGKRLFVFGADFDPGAAILLNGDEQKTRNDGANANTILIGKKAGKKIKAGDKLQVRNPNGKLSEEFTFTGI